MAKITVTNTSGRIETHIRGRVFRFRESRSAKTPRQVKSPEKRLVCVLSHQGGRELEHWGMEQPCFGPGCQHAHLTQPVVSKMVADGIMKWCGIGKNVAAYTYGRTWKGKASGESGQGRPKVMQLC